MLYWEMNANRPQHCAEEMSIQQRNKLLLLLKYIFCSRVQHLQSFIQIEKNDHCAGSLTCSHSAHTFMTCFMWQICGRAARQGSLRYPALIFYILSSQHLFCSRPQSQRQLFHVEDNWILAINQFSSAVRLLPLITFLQRKATT